MSITLPWNELWSIYKRMPEHVQADILKQLDIQSIIEHGSKKVRKEVMAEAPESIQQMMQAPATNPYSGMTQSELLKTLFGKHGTIRR